MCALPGSIYLSFLTMNNLKLLRFIHEFFLIIAHPILPGFIYGFVLTMAHPSLFVETLWGGKDGSQFRGVLNHQQECKGAQRHNQHFLHMWFPPQDHKPHNI